MADEGKNVIMQIDEEVFFDLTASIKKGDKAIKALALLQFQMSIVEDAIRNDRCVTCDDEGILIDNMSLDKHTEMYMAILMSQKDKGETA